MPVEELFPVVYDIPAIGYFVSMDGDVWSNKKEGFKKLKPYVSQYGYLRCCLTINNKQHRVNIHRLVAATFHGLRPKKAVCRHLDGNKLNNKSDNLVWGTQADNVNDRHTHGTMCQGDTHYLSLLSDAEVKRVRAMYAEGIPQTHIANIFGVSKHNIFNYVHGRSRRSA